MATTRIDCDIHPAVGGTRTTLLPYLNDHWKEQVQDVLLLVAMYCGVPAAIDTNRIAAEIFDAAPGSVAKP